LDVYRCYGPKSLSHEAYKVALIKAAKAVPG
jgi:hypothetical protein